MSVIAQNVKKIMNQIGLKQYVLATNAGYKPKELSNMLNGRKIIKAEDVQILADALGVMPNDLYVIPEKNKAS